MHVLPPQLCPPVRQSLPLVTMPLVTMHVSPPQLCPSVHRLTPPLITPFLLDCFPIASHHHHHHHPIYLLLECFSKALSSVLLDSICWAMRCVTSLNTLAWFPLCFPWGLFFPGHHAKWMASTPFAQCMFLACNPLAAVLGAPRPLRGGRMETLHAKLPYITLVGRSPHTYLLRKSNMGAAWC